MKKLIVLSAPSGAGKTTLCKKLLSDFPKLEISISCTTRPPRGKELHGKDYYFLSQEDFKKRIDSNRFAEWALVHGNYYGTSKESIEKTFEKNKAVLLDIDVQGAESLKRAYQKDCFLIFIAPPSMSILERRLRSRGTENEESIQKRLRNAAQEMKSMERFDCIIVNDDFDAAYHELHAVVQNQLHPELGFDKKYE